MYIYIYIIVCSINIQLRINYFHYGNLFYHSWLSDATPINFLFIRSHRRGSVKRRQKISYIIRIKNYARYEK